MTNGGLFLRKLKKFAASALVCAMICTMSITGYSAAETDTPAYEVQETTYKVQETQPTEATPLTEPSTSPTEYEEPTTVKPEHLTLNKTSILLGVNEKFKLTVKTNADVSLLRFVSSNTAVVNVLGDGTLVPKAAGKAVVECIAPSGTTARCAVSVAKAPKSVSLNSSVKTLGAGESFTLVSSVPKGTAAYSRTYRSSNTRVAVVGKTDGAIKAKAVGTATIYCTLYNGVNAKCKITVKKAPTAVTLSTKSLTLGVGESFKIKSALSKNSAGSLKWYTGNKKIVTVTSKNVITARGKGTAKLTLKTYNGKTAVCTVTVKPMANSVTLNAKEIIMYAGGTFDLNSSIPKGTAAYYRIYSSSNPKVAAMEKGGVVKCLKVGTATVTCKLNNGKKAICRVYIMPKSKKISNVPLVGQKRLPTGCETCSAVMLLNFNGYKISETTFADKYLIKKPFTYSGYGFAAPDPNCAFVGTPYSSNSFGAYSPVMAKSMNNYLAKKSHKAVKISGKSLEYLCGRYIAQGQPVMVWATINMSASFRTTTWRVNYTDENAVYKLGSNYTWLANEHCLLLTGYDSKYYYFNDPWTNARTAYSKNLVNTRYKELGKQAVVMVKK